MAAALVVTTKFAIPWFIPQQAGWGMVPKVASTSLSVWIHVYVVLMLFGL